MTKKMARLRATRQGSTMMGKAKSGEVRYGEESHIDARRGNAEQSETRQDSAMRQREVRQGEDNRSYGRSIRYGRFDPMDDRYDTDDSRGEEQQVDARRVDAEQSVE